MHVLNGGLHRTVNEVDQETIAHGEVLHRPDDTATGLLEHAVSSLKHVSRVGGAEGCFKACQFGTLGTDVTCCGTLQRMPVFRKPSCSHVEASIDRGIETRTKVRNLASCAGQARHRSPGQTVSKEAVMLADFAQASGCGRFETEHKVVVVLLKVEPNRHHAFCRVRGR